MMVKIFDSKRFWGMGDFSSCFYSPACELFGKERKNRHYPVRTRLLLVRHGLTLNVLIMHKLEWATIHIIYSVT